MTLLTSDAGARRDITAIAHREGFAGAAAAVHEEEWARVEAREGSAADWYGLVFEAFRRLLLASVGEPHVDTLLRRAVKGSEPGESAMPEWAFWRELRAGRRGVFDGTSAAFELRGRERSHLVVIMAFVGYTGVTLLVSEIAREPT